MVEIQHRTTTAWTPNWAKLQIKHQAWEGFRLTGYGFVMDGRVIQMHFTRKLCECGDWRCFGFQKEE